MFGFALTGTIFYERRTRGRRVFSVFHLKTKKFFNIWMITFQSQTKVFYITYAYRLLLLQL